MLKPNSTLSSLVKFTTSAKILTHMSRDFTKANSFGVCVHRILKEYLMYSESITFACFARIIKTTEDKQICEEGIEK